MTLNSIKIQKWIRIFSRLQQNYIASSDKSRYFKIFLLLTAKQQTDRTTLRTTQKAKKSELPILAPIWRFQWLKNRNDIGAFLIIQNMKNDSENNLNFFCSSFKRKQNMVRLIQKKFHEWRLKVVFLELKMAFSSKKRVPTLHKSSLPPPPLLIDEEETQRAFLFQKHFCSHVNIKISSKCQILLQ